MESYSFGHYLRLMTIVEDEDEDETFLKTESFAFFDNSRFMTTEYCKARITALPLPILVFSSSTYLPSLMNNPKIFKLLHLFQCGCSTNLQ